VGDIKLMISTHFWFYRKASRVWHLLIKTSPAFMLEIAIKKTVIHSFNLLPNNSESLIAEAIISSIDCQSSLSENKLKL
jgi:hypothetical protein